MIVLVQRIRQAAARDFADMIATLDRFTDSDIPVPDSSSAAELRAYYADWRSELGKLTGGEQEVSNCSAVVGKGTRGGVGTVVGVDAGGRAAAF
jgi:hypothetical protein